MSNKNNNNTATVNTAFEVKSALILANKNGNKKAINASMAQEAGVDKIVLESWKIGVEKLRSAIAPYIVEKGLKEPDAKKLTKLRAKIYPCWEKLIKKGDATIVTDLRADVDSLIGFAETWVATPKGSVWAVDSPTIFRKSVEAYLGCKIVRNAVLQDADRDAIKATMSAENSIKKNELLLNGKDADGTHTNGIIDNLGIAENKVEALKIKVKEIAGFAKKADGEMKKFFEDMKEDLKKDLKFNEDEVERLKKEKTDAEEAIKKAKTVIDENREQYEKAMDAIEEIEG